MKQQLGWCSLEQSKKLIKAGLKLDTADMLYLYDYNNHKHNNIPDTLIIYNWDDPYNKSIPCWSLGQLIELMPDTISIGLKTYCLWINSKSCGYYRMKETLPTSGDCLCSYFKYNNSNPIFDCMLFLLENNYIKKGETK